MKLLANIDGASRGNPGPGASAAVLRNAEGTKVRECGLYLGECTNNVAEYTALALALELALTSGATELDVCSDSELLVKQYSGEYKIKNAELAALMSGIRAQAAKFQRVSLKHVPREQNSAPDALANITLDLAAKHAPKGVGRQMNLF